MPSKSTPNITPTTMMASAGTPTLVGMPGELSNHIASFLSQADFAALRLTCKSLENGTFNQFLRQFFHSRTITLPDENKLATLRQISKRSSISAGLQKITLRACPTSQSDTVYQPCADCASHPNLAHPRHLESLSGDKLFGYGHALRDQMMLAEIFSNCPNLKSVIIDRAAIGEYPQEEFYVNRRDFWLLDSDDGGFSDDEIIWLHYAFNSHFLAVVLAALADAKTRLDHLDVRFFNTTADWFVCAHYGPDEREPGLAPLLSGLQRLEFGEGPGHAFTPDWRGGCHLYKKVLMSLATNVTELTLYFEWETISHVGDSLLVWLGGTPVSDTAKTSSAETPSSGRLPAVAWTRPSPNPPAFPQLQYLVLVSALVTQRTLVALVGKFGSTLKELCLDHVRLIDNEHEKEDRVNPWRSVLIAMATSLDLTYFCIDTPSIVRMDIGVSLEGPPDALEDRYSGWFGIGIPVLFSSGRNKPSQSSCVEYSGRNAKAVLRKLSNSMAVDWSADIGDSEDEEGAQPVVSEEEQTAEAAAVLESDVMLGDDGLLEEYEDGLSFFNTVSSVNAEGGGQDEEIT